MEVSASSGSVLHTPGPTLCVTEYSYVGKDVIYLSASGTEVILTVKGLHIDIFLLIYFLSVTVLEYIWYVISCVGKHFLTKTNPQSGNTNSDWTYL